MNKTSQIKNDSPAQFVIEIVRIVVFTISKIFWRIEFHNTENIPQDLKSGLVVAPNHQTYFDPFWICVPIKRRFRFMAWDAVFGWFFVGKVISYLGAFPVSLKRGGSIDALKKALKVLREGDTLIMFPEGEREFSDGNLLEFRTGAVRIAYDANVPILPVTIKGGNKVWSQDHKLPRFRKVKIIYHPVIETSTSQNIENKRNHVAQLNTKLKELIASEM